jgi:hypothetical protein
MPIKLIEGSYISPGFKSYPVRTQITGWDPSFNAITGLNGSGKSNILDAICFVLGMTNMTSVRKKFLEYDSGLLKYTLRMTRCEHKTNKILYISEDRQESPKLVFQLSSIIRTPTQCPLGNTVRSRLRYQDRCGVLSSLTAFRVDSARPIRIDCTTKRL